MARFGVNEEADAMAELAKAHVKYKLDASAYYDEAKLCSFTSGDGGSPYRHVLRCEPRAVGCAPMRRSAYREIIP